MHRVIVVEPESEGNIGFICRLVENFAIDELFLVNPQCEIGDVAESRASHAQDTLKDARIIDELDHATNELDMLVGTTGLTGSDENVLRTTITPRQMTDQLPEDADIGVMLGREGKGLTNAELDRCDFTVRIPTSDAYEVMNLSHAAGVICYELFLSQKDSDDTSTKYNIGDTPSSRKKRSVLENLFKDTTETFDWEPDRTEKTLRAFRNVIGRSYITDRELSLLLGFMREVKRSLNKGG